MKQCGPAHKGFAELELAKLETWFLQKIHDPSVRQGVEEKLGEMYRSYEELEDHEKTAQKIMVELERDGRDEVTRKIDQIEDDLMEVEHYMNEILIEINSAIENEKTTAEGHNVDLSEEDLLDPANFAEPLGSYQNPGVSCKAIFADIAAKFPDADQPSEFSYWYILLPYPLLFFLCL